MREVSKNLSHSCKDAQLLHTKPFKFDLTVWICCNYDGCVSIYSIPIKGHMWLLFIRFVIFCFAIINNQQCIPQTTSSWSSDPWPWSNVNHHAQTHGDIIAIIQTKMVLEMEIKFLQWLVRPKTKCCATWSQTWCWLIRNGGLFDSIFVTGSPFIISGPSGSQLSFAPCAVRENFFSSLVFAHEQPVPLFTFVCQLASYLMTQNDRSNSYGFSTSVVSLEWADEHQCIISRSCILSPAAKSPIQTDWYPLYLLSSSVSPNCGNIMNSGCLIRGFQLPLTSLASVM